LGITEKLPFFPFLFQNKAEDEKMRIGKDERSGWLFSKDMQKGKKYLLRYIETGQKETNKHKMVECLKFQGRTDTLLGDIFVMPFKIEPTPEFVSKHGTESEKWVKDEMMTLWTEDGYIILVGL
jgi:hypothetical protein